MDRNLPKNEQKLLEWVRPHLSDMKKFEQILDPRLDGNYSLKSAQKLAAVANKCLIRHPKNRPRMSEVLEIVNKIVEESSAGSPPISLETKEKESEEKVKEEGVSRRRRRFVDHIGGGENMKLVWRSWRPKLVKVT